MNEQRQRSSPASPFASPLLISLLGVGLLFFLSLGIHALFHRDPEEPHLAADSHHTSTSTAQASSSAAPDSKHPSSDTAAPSPNSSEHNMESTSATAESTDVIATSPPEPEPTVTMTTVDESYFSDALFIGDSRTNGLCMFNTPGACKHYAFDSMNIFTVMGSDNEAYGFKGLRSLLQGMQFGKIYIMFGINECGYSTSSFAQKYQAVIEEIRRYQPDALIYIQSICYVTQKREAEDSTFSTANIKEKNAPLRELANDVDIFYLEVNDCMNDGTDHLPAEYTNDGVHLKVSYYKLWLNYLLEHAVVDEKHPWTPNGTAPVGAEAEHP